MALVAVGTVALLSSRAGPASGAGNTITSPDTTGSAAAFTSLALNASGNPVISYYDGTNGDLKLLHCGNATCTSGNSITSPDTAGNVGSWASLELDTSGNPVVSYNFSPGFADGDLRVLHCGNPSCTSGNTIASPDTFADTGFYLSLALDGSGNPVVSYLVGSNITDLKVLHCGNATCTAGNTIATPDSAGDVGFTTSLALDAGGNPVVSSWDGGNRDLKLLHCGNPTCTASNSVASPDTAGDVGGNTSLALDSSGNPVVSYYDDTNDDLKVLHCNDANCVGGGESITAPDTAGNVVHPSGYSTTSLALDASGNPVVSYYDGTSLDLKVLHCNDANCAGGGESIASPDTAGDVGQAASLVLDGSGNPVVSYWDTTNGALKVLHCGDPNCMGKPTPTATHTPTDTPTNTPTATPTPTSASTETATLVQQITGTPTPRATPPPPVGGISRDPRAEQLALEAPESTEPRGYAIVAGAAVAVTLAVAAMGTAAWYARRRVR